MFFHEEPVTRQKMKKKFNFTSFSAEKMSFSAFKAGTK